MQQAQFLRRDISRKILVSISPFELKKALLLFILGNKSKLTWPSASPRCTRICDVQELWAEKSCGIHIYFSHLIAKYKTRYKIIWKSPVEFTIIFLIELQKQHKIRNSRGKVVEIGRYKSTAHYFRDRTQNGLSWSLPPQFLTSLTPF